VGTWQQRHKVVLVVFLLFIDKDKVLLLRRFQTGYKDGFYNVPSGHVDGNESAISAACREAKEEVGVDIKPEWLKLVHTMHEKAEEHERLNLGFMVDHYNGVIRNAEPHKCDELLWAYIHELPDNIVSSVRGIIENTDQGKPYSDLNF
jgi:8-oxo-dGTP diphosphatase